LTEGRSSTTTTRCRNSAAAAAELIEPLSGEHSTEEGRKLTGERH
jgi:hypothetical protein